MWQLNLRNYFYPEISVKARKEHMSRAREGQRRQPEVELKMEYRLKEDQKELAVDVSMHSVESSDLDPYDFRVQIFGTFMLQHEEDPSNNAQLDEEFFSAEKFYVQNCIQILIGAMRDAVSSATAKSAYGPLFLNTAYIGLEDVPERPTADE